VSLGILIALIRVIRKETNRLKAFVQIMGAMSMILWCVFILVHLLEQGSFIAAAIVNSVWLIVTHIQGYALWYSFVSPVYSAQCRDETKLRKRLIRTTLACCMFYVAYGVVIAYFSVAGDEETFNLLVAIGFIVYVYVIFTASCIGILHHIYVLRQLCYHTLQNQHAADAAGSNMTGLVSNASAVKGIESFMKQSAHLQRALRVFFATLAISSIPFPVAYFVVGTLPFAWIFFIVMGVGSQTICVGYIVFDAKVKDTTAGTERESKSGSTLMVRMVEDSGKA